MNTCYLWNWRRIFGWAVMIAWFLPTIGLQATTGIVTAWGYNNYNQTNIPRDLTNVVGIAAGQNNSMALRSDGTVVVWGDNSYQQMNVPTEANHVTNMAAGDAHCLAVRQDGTVISWGNNNSGQTNVPANLTNAIAVAAGTAYSLALRRDGTVVAWGNNNYHQTNVPAGLSNVTAIAAGWYGCLALKADGTVVAWGFLQPYTNVPANLTNAVAIAAGYSHAVALRNDHTVVAWGSNVSLTNVPANLSNVVAISANTAFTLALKADGTVVAWGNSSFLASVPAGLTNMASVAAGGQVGLALQDESAPVFSTQPLSRNGNAGASAAFAVQLFGARPIHHQWQHNGTDIAGATNDSLQLSNLQPSDGGDYRLLATNLYGTTLSSNAILTIITSPVFITAPASQTALPGSNATFSASVDGAAPLFYQWQFNGKDLAGATNPSLTITNVQQANLGGYSLTVSNAYSSITSPAANLTLIDLGVALDAPDLAWTTSNNPAWFPETSITHDGVAAACSGPICPTNLSSLQTVVQGPCTLSFWWQALGLYSGWSEFSFAIDGTNQAQISIPTRWQQSTFYLPAGAHTLRWYTSWTMSATYIYDTNWLDEVSYAYGATGAMILSAPANRTVSAGTSVTFSVSAGGTPPLSYQWLFNGNTITNATGPSLTLNDAQAASAGTYTVQVSNDEDQAKASATLTVTPAPPAVVTQPRNQEMVPGGQVTFSIAARGSEPFLYQWQHNGTNVPAGTSSWLTLPQVQTNDTGIYYVTVSNACGGFVSTNATLILVPTVVVGWGENAFGQCSVPLGLTNIAAISAADETSMALRTNGSVAVWGDGGFGQTNVPGDLTNAVAISVGDIHCVALRSSGSVAAWGEGSQGQTNVPADLTNAVAISAGLDISLAVRKTGTLAGWGDDFFGGLDYPTNLSNAVSVAAGWWKGLALQRDGTVVSWGTQAPSSLSNVVQISASEFLCGALKADGTVCVWEPGEPAPPANLTNVVSFSAGGFQYVALQGDGTVSAWGGDVSGSTEVPAWLTNAVAVASGDDFCLALLNDGSPYFTRQPWNQTALSGETVRFSPVVLGAAPIRYQWTWNGTNIDGATNQTYTITNAALSCAGVYQCWASNSVGTAQSQPVSLAVLRSAPQWTTASGALHWDATQGFGLRLNNLSGHGPVVIYASTNLVTWQSIYTNPAVIGTLLYHDAGATNQRARFYRAVER